MEKKKSFAESVSEKIIEQLEKGSAPWQKPWKSGEPSKLPMNPISGKRYKGINTLNLMIESTIKGYSDPRWLTYNQAQSLGGQVKKGEKSSLVQYWKFTDKIDKLDEDGKPVLDEEGKKVKIEVELDKPKVFYAYVFNAEQVDNMPPLPPQEKFVWNSIDRAEEILKKSGAKIFHDQKDNAFYSCRKDEIHLPPKEQFESAVGYYETALHELAHWTGAESRLNRDLLHPFGSEGYAREELRAEIASMIIGDELNIGHDPGQHIAYVNSWIKALKEDPLEIFRAASDAEKIYNFTLDLEQKQEQIKQYDLTPDDINLSIILNQLQNTAKDSDIYTDIVNLFKISAEACIGPKIPGLQDELPLDWDGRVQINPVIFTGSYEAGDLEAVVLSPDEVEKVDYITWELNVGRRDGSWQWLASNMNPIELNDNGNGFVTSKEVNKEIQLMSDKLQAVYERANMNNINNTEIDKTSTEIDKTNTEIDKTNLAVERTILVIPYDQKEIVKAIAGKLADGSNAIEWSKPERVWFAKPGADLEKLKPWLPENQIIPQEIKLTPKEEFAEELKAIGCIISGEHPIMDGKNHRIAVVGDKKGETAGFYKAFLDGHPAGYMKNNRTGIEMRWKSKGYHLSEEEKAKLNAEAAIKREERLKIQELEYESAALKAQEQFSKLKPVDETSTPYLINKGVDVYPGISIDTKSNITYVPAYDADGKQWSSQYIKEDGQKGFIKGSKKQGCFHVIGGQEALKNAPVLIISEGYATAASITKAVGYSTVAAFDAGNLKSVATSLHEKYPNKPIIIAGDDDRKLEETQKVNPGRTKAIDAAAAVNGKAIFPIFAPGEEMKFTDFNDLAVKSTLGKDAIVRQIEAAISLNANRQEQYKQNQHQQKKVTIKQSLKI